MKKALVIIALIIAAASAIADPNASELKAFYNLIPDYAGVNGATDPAISPDGNTLAFLTDQPGLWILSDVNRFSALKEGKGYPHAEPWRITTPRIKPRPDVVVDLSSAPEYGRVDWSPDGKSIAYVHDGALWLAEGIDSAKHTACVRALAQPLTEAELKPPCDTRGGTQSGIASPRWSPDGSRIAFVRMHVGESNTLCVIDVKSGKETRLTTDSYPILSTRPWSADGKTLAYSKVKPGTDTVEGVRTAAAAGGGAPADVAAGEGRVLMGPSWLPDGRLVASGFSFPTSTDEPSNAFDTFVTVGGTVFAVDMKSSSASQISRMDPLAAKRIELARSEADARMRRSIEDQYHSEMTPDQIKRLRDGSMATGEIVFVMLKREFRRKAIEQGGSFEKVVEKALSTNPTTMEAFSDALNSATDEIGLPADQTKGWNLNVSLGSGTALLEPIMDYDPCPSPDGARIAFLRQGIDPDADQLWLLDMATGKEVMLMSSGDIKDVRWTADGKRLVVQADRTLALKRDDKPTKDGKRTMTWPSYGEVWLLEPK